MNRDDFGGIEVVFRFDHDNLVRVFSAEHSTGTIEHGRLFHCRSGNQNRTRVDNCAPERHDEGPQSFPRRPAANHMSRSLIVLPDDSAKPIVDAIEEAKDSLRIKMFVLSDPQLMRALVSAHRRGIQVKIMLNPERRSGKKENAESRKLLSEAGIEVRDSNPAFDRAFATVQSDPSWRSCPQVLSLRCWDRSLDIDGWRPPVY